MNEGREVEEDAASGFRLTVQWEREMNKPVTLGFKVVSSVLQYKSL